MGSGFQFFNGLRCERDIMENIKGDIMEKEKLEKESLIVYVEEPSRDC